MILTHCQTALNAAHAALPAVERYHLAGGPELALTCHMIAVYPAPITTKKFGDECAFRGDPQIVVAYAKDCYPMADPDKPKVLPTPAELDSWTTDYLTDVWSLWDGLLDAVIAGQFGGACTSVTVAPANFAGPRGGCCSVRIPLTISGDAG